MIKYSKELPPNWDMIQATFKGVTWERGIIVTYGDTYYCKEKVSDDLEAHEETHMRQQEAWGVEEWWKNYIENPVFRLDQEVEAYKNQLAFLRNKMMAFSRNERRYKIKQYQEHFAMILSSDIYGHMIQYNQALQKLL